MGTERFETHPVPSGRTPQNRRGLRWSRVIVLRHQELQQKQQFYGPCQVPRYGKGGLGRDGERVDGMGGGECELGGCGGKGPGWVNVVDVGGVNVCWVNVVDVGGVNVYWVDVVDVGGV